MSQRISTGIRCICNCKESGVLPKWGGCVGKCPGALVHTCVNDDICSLACHTLSVLTCVYFHHCNVPSIEFPCKADPDRNSSSGCPIFDSSDQHNLTDAQDDIPMEIY